MRRLMLITIAMTIGGHAFAADIAPRWAPVQPVAPTWAGFYLGLNVGGGSGDGLSDFYVGSTQFAEINNLISGGIGGAQIGFNSQNGAFVYGLETDFQFAGLKGSLTAPTCPAAACGALLAARYEQELPWFGTVRGRVGYSGGAWLAYVTGGYAYTQLETRADAQAGPAVATFRQDQFRNGWTIGGGVEFAITQTWSAKLEYLYMDFGEKTANWAIAPLPVVSDRAELTMNVVRGGINMRF